MSDCKDLVFDFTELAGVLSLGQVRKEKSGRKHTSAISLRTSFCGSSTGTNTQDDVVNISLSLEEFISKITKMVA